MHESKGLTTAPKREKLGSRLGFILLRLGIDRLRGFFGHDRHFRFMPAPIHLLNCDAEGG